MDSGDRSGHRQHGMGSAGPTSLCPVCSWLWQCYAHGWFEPIERSADCEQDSIVVRVGARWYFALWTPGDGGRRIPRTGAADGPLDARRHGFCPEHGHFAWYCNESGAPVDLEVEVWPRRGR